MSIIINNNEWSICLVSSKQCFEKEVITCLFSQHPYIKELIEEDIKDAEFRKYPHYMIYIIPDNEFYDMMKCHICRNNPLQKREKENRIMVANVCYNRVYAGDPYSVQRTLGRFRIHPEYRNIKEYLKNKIVDKYLIDDVRDLIII